MKYRVAVDLDNTIWNLTEPWINQYNKISGDKLKTEDIKTYNITDYIDGQHEELLYYILEMPYFWDDVELYDGASDAINQLLDNEDIDLIIATATPYDTADYKINRLFDLLPRLKDEAHLILTERKDLLDVDIIVDDYEKNLEHIRNKKTCTGFIIDQQYNQHFNNLAYGIKRCSSLYEAVNEIEKYII